ncbi:hypothetical protein R5H32_17055 [Defluviimonas sp. D31]|uniref:DUF6932 family protein n=1 Tax=Defluviimonas sp. D31 TaxID=3083253 RepID=UPI00296FD67B|nr:hypothetical protein [Defluviimonas sp. D31]MDW4551073.1 hypothetical protein [Defluviimonas sp. D31]
MAHQTIAVTRNFPLGLQLKIAKVLTYIRRYCQANIPNFDAGGALPAFVGSDPTKPAVRSPYKTHMDFLVTRFLTSKERAKLLLGLNEYRKHLWSGGFISGMQWIDGSFVEDVETTRRRPPKDVDVLTLFNRPLKYHGDIISWKSDYKAFIHKRFFDTQVLKPIYGCDCYGLDLDTDAYNIVGNASYWFGLFSEQRYSLRRKGIVAIPLATDRMEFDKIETQIRVKFDV